MQCNRQTRRIRCDALPCVALGCHALLCVAMRCLGLPRGERGGNARQRNANAGSPHRKSDCRRSGNERTYLGLAVTPCPIHREENPVKAIASATVLVLAISTVSAQERIPQ